MLPINTMKQKPNQYQCDIAIIGGSMGGVAAALAALEQGYSVILTEATDWLGGQMTSQGVSAFDEHPPIETFGCTKRYRKLRERIRKHYQEKYGINPVLKNGQPLNPGNGWVSHLCFEPKVGINVLEEMLEAHLSSGNLQIFYQYEAVKASVKNNLVKEITLQNGKKNIIRISANYFLDATDLGDLLPLTKTEYVTGAEAKADTNEPHAKAEAKPDEVQSFTFCFAVEYCPNEKHTINKPKDYERFKNTQPYSLTLDVHTRPRHFKMFKRGSKGTLPFWTYRRIFDSSLFKSSEQANDIALINWASNDYRFANIIDKSKQEQKRILREAKNLSLGFLYWLQTECPRDEGGFGYPEFKLRKDVMGTKDGLSKAPYIRESRRIKALERILEQDITQHSKRKRAKDYKNSVGIGWYQMDVHPCVGNDDVSMFEPTLPFQIPLGALIPVITKNLLPACKNIGTTHLTNGAYRLHLTEWAMGEAAGTLAAFCLKQQKIPRQVWESKQLTKSLQKMLIEQGAPLEWEREDSLAVMLD
jgi:FAD dependent oxidoreductase